MGTVGLLWRRPRARRPPPTWLACREGLVHFGPEVVHFHPWTSLGLEAGTLVQVAPPHVYVHRRAAVVGEPWTSLPADVAAQAAEALQDPDARRALPTFEQPDGPPEAVLANTTPR